MRLARRLRQEDSASGTTISQLSALAVIHAHGPLTVSDLAARERVRPPTMTRLVAALEAEGLISREGDPEDRRVVMLRATASGRRAVEKSRERRTAYLLDQLATLNEAEQRRLVAVLPLLERLANG